MIMMLTSVWTMVCHLIWKIDFNVLSASSPKIIQVLMCPKHGHARHSDLKISSRAIGPFRSSEDLSHCGARLVAGLVPGIS